MADSSPTSEPHPDAPWFAAIRPWVERVGWPDGSEPWMARANQAARQIDARSGSGLPLRFVDAASAVGGAYESHIAHTGEVPTRLRGDGLWHDGLNALVWLAFPRTKARLNALQAAEIARDGVRATRGPLRDAITLLDESGALLLTRDASIVNDLAGLDWPALFGQGGRRFARQARVSVLGHALLDKLRTPYKSICARVWPIVCEASDLDRPDRFDELAARSLGGDALHREALLPLPVLGIPGWCSANRDPAFYDDASVFRAARGRRATNAAGDH